MSDPATRLARAEAAELLARARFEATFGVLKQRLEPHRLAEEAKREVAVAGVAARRRTAAAAREHPGWLSGAVAAAGLFLARHRIAALFRRRPETPDDDDR